MLPVLALLFGTPPWIPGPWTPQGDARPTLTATLGVGGGHDDNILGRIGSATTGPDTTLESTFGQLSPGIEGRLGAARFEIEGGYALTWNGFTDEAAGSYRDQRIDAAARWMPVDRLEIGAAGRSEWFRRTRFSDYDLDHRGGGVSIRYQPSPRVRFCAAVDVARDTYPKSQVTIGAPILQRFARQVDDPTLLEAEVEAHLLPRVELRAGGRRIETASSITRFAWEGRQLFAGVGWSPGRRLSLRFDWAHETRDYDDYLLPEPGVDPLTCLRPSARCAHREDASDSYGVEIRHSLGERLIAEASFSRIDYRSNSDDFRFDQNRVRVGLEIRLARTGGATELTLGADLVPFARNSEATGLAPRITEDGVQFRCRAPEAASMALVGSFNDWSRGTSPLSDPDGDGLWEITVELPSGVHRYMFLKDGREWIRPEDAVMYEDDGFGLTNGIVIVP